MKQLIQHINQRRYANSVRILRQRLGPGDRVRVVRGDGVKPGLVLNVRSYAHGSAEAYVQGDGHTFAGWVSVEHLLPETSFQPH